MPGLRGLKQLSIFSLGFRVKGLGFKGLGFRVTRRFMFSRCAASTCVYLRASTHMVWRKGISAHRCITNGV